MGANGGSSGGGWKARGFNPADLDEHHEKHKREFNPQPDKATYNYRAVQLLNSNIGGNILGFTSKGGWIFRYNVITNEFAIGRPDGSVATYYKPIDGLEYWLGEEEKYGK